MQLQGARLIMTVIVVELIVQVARGGGGCVGWRRGRAERLQVVLQLRAANLIVAAAQVTILKVMVEMVVVVIMT